MKKIRPQSPKPPYLTLATDSWQILQQNMSENASIPVEVCRKQSYEHLVDFMESRGYLALGTLFGDMDRKDAAVDYLKKAEGMFKEIGMDFYVKQTQAALKKL